MAQTSLPGLEEPGVLSSSDILISLKLLILF